MHEPVGILTDILAAVAVMFIIPVIISGNMADRIADMYVRQATEQFEQSVCAKGYIESSAYEALLGRINLAGSVRNVDIVSRTTVWEPVYEDGVFTGSAINYERESGTEEILEIMYERGRYALRQDDTVEVTVWNDRGSLVYVTGTVKGRQSE